MCGIRYIYVCIMYVYTTHCHVHTPGSMEEIKRGPWAIEEDKLLVHYIACNGEGRWNILAKCSGLKRTGKSCRLRWLNYLKPDVKRGNLTLEEQILILDLHSKWGNRWARIAQHLPGRTDNEIKNYWRTRVQKQAKQLNIDVNSAIFRDVVRYFLLPRLVQGIEMDSNPACCSSSSQVNKFAINSAGDMRRQLVGILGSLQIPLSPIENTTISCPNIWANRITSTNQQQTREIDNLFWNIDGAIDGDQMSLDGLELIYPGTVAPAEPDDITGSLAVLDSSSIMMEDDSLWTEYLDDPEILCDIP